MSFRVKSIGEIEEEKSNGSYKIKSVESPPSFQEQIDIAPYLAAREAGASFKSIPRTLSGVLKHGSKKLQDLGEEQALLQGREINPEGDPITNAIVWALGKPEELFEKIGLPTHEEAKKGITKSISKNAGVNLPPEGRTGLERFSEGAGGAVPYATGASPLSALGLIGGAGISKAGEFDPGSEALTTIGLPVVLELIKLISSRKYTPQPGEAKNLYNVGKQLGLSDEQLSPVLASEGQIGRYGKFAAGRKQTRDAFQNTYEALGDTVESFQNRAQNFRPVSPQQEQNFVNALQRIEDDIRNRTVKLSPEEATHADFIRGTIQNIQNNGLNPRQAIGLWRSVNRIGLGQTELSRLRNPITKLLNDADPALAKDFQATNKMYQRYFNNLKEINPTAYNAFIDAGEMQKLLGAVFSGEASTLGKSILNIASFGQLKRLSTAMITNPRFQSLSRKFKIAVNSGRESTQRAFYKQFQDLIKKEYPDEYKDINWPEK